jgi:type I restriction enzyme R subunit
VKLASGDYIDLKMYDPAMRHLIDTYIRAEESEKISAFDDLSLIDLIVERGADAIDALPKGIRGNEQAMAETIENNVRRLIIDEHPVNPKYYDRMSKLLDALIAERRQKAGDYKKYLEKIVKLTRQVKNGVAYPKALDTRAKRAMYDNLDKNEPLAITIDRAIQSNRQADWIGSKLKVKLVRNAIKSVLEFNFGPVSLRTAESDEKIHTHSELTEEQIDKMADELVELAQHQYEYTQD